jgi:hypothetical protein
LASSRLPSEGLRACRAGNRTAVAVRSAFGGLHTESRDISPVFCRYTNTSSEDQFKSLYTSLQTCPTRSQPRPQPSCCWYVQPACLRSGIQQQAPSAPRLASLCSIPSPGMVPKRSHLGTCPWTRGHTPPTGDWIQAGAPPTALTLHPSPQSNW